MNTSVMSRVIVCLCVIAGAVPILPDVRRVQDDLELSLDVASEKYPHCGAVNLFPGFSAMLAYTCRSCGQLLR